MIKFLYTLVILSIAACGGNAPKNLSEIKINTSNLSNLSFNDIYQVKKVIPLETSDESLLGQIISVCYVNDHIYIRTGAHSMSCNGYTVFNNEGQFVYKQSKVGRGPGEYLKISSLHFNGDSIIVANGNKLIYYNTKGELIFENSNMPDKMYFDMFYVGDGTILANYVRPTVDEGNYFSLQLFSKTGENLKGFLPIREEFTKTLTFTSIPLFIRNNSSIYYTPMVRNAIYEYIPKNMELKEIYRIILDNKPVFDVNLIDYTDNWFLDNHKIWIGSISKESMLLFIMNPRGVYYAYVNRESNHVELFSKENFTDKQNSLPVSLVASGEEDLISIISYKDLEPLVITDTSTIGYKLKQSMNENSNPAIVIYKRR